MKNNKGFSLVELIVVIAIMAILAAVAVIGVSVYIPKAQQASDEQMISDIEHALTLYYYSNPDAATDGVLVLNVNDVAQSESQFVIDAMRASYGEDWQSELALQYDGWNATFQNSSFSGNEQGLTVLLGTVEDLTEALGGFLNNETVAGMLGDNFNSYMTEMEATTANQKADAAVFYVADITAGLPSSSLQNAANAIEANLAGGSDAVMGAMNAELGSTMASAATMYALAEGYATFFENGNYEVINQTDGASKTPRQILTDATAGIQAAAGNYSSTGAAFADLLTAFEKMGRVNPDAMTAYTAQNNGVSPMAQDMNAFSDAMKTVSSSKENILENNGAALGTDGYFTSTYVQGLVDSYAEGGVFVYVKVEDDGLKISTSNDAE